VHAFVERHRARLARRPSAFFSVNLVARKPGKDTAASNPYVRAFLRRTAWMPTEQAVFAGRVDYPRYRFVDRQVIRFIMWLTDGPTDPGVRIEYTDWAAVDAFARRIAAL
jgi:menaquinone-dependent protoporphyrinogen oxidase